MEAWLVICVSLSPLFPNTDRIVALMSIDVDRTCQYLVSTAGNRGWEGANTEVLLGYEIMW